MSRICAGLMLPPVLLLLLAPLALRDPLSLAGLAILAVAGLLAAFAAALTRLPPKVGLAAVATVYPICLTGSLLFTISAQFRHEVRNLIEGRVAVGIWKTDDRYGYRHIPNSVGEHIVPGGFHVTYTIDAEGCRATPDPGPGSDVVLILGDSLAFGHGVEDDEAYTAVLARRHWPDVKVRNRGVAGWGTPHAYLTLEDELRGGLRPRWVLYSWNSDHVRRNYIHRGWVWIMAHYGRKHPWFDIEEGELVFRGTIGLDRSLIATPETNRRAIDVTIRLIEGIQDMAISAGAEFAILRFNWAGRLGVSPVRRAREKLVLDALAARNIRVVDLGAIKGEPIPVDGHPEARWHVRAAERVAREITW